MGNKTNDRNWAATQRLRFIEACAWWKGVVQTIERRKDAGGAVQATTRDASGRAWAGV